MSLDPIQLISLALDAAAMRQTAIANNIANINTTDYHPIEVNFEQQLNELNNDFNQQIEESALSIQPQFQLSNKKNAIDEQLFLNVENSTHYRALIKGLNQKFAIMKLAIQGPN